jgi:hypothetical protein
MTRTPDASVIVNTFAQFRQHGFLIKAHWACGHIQALDLDQMIAVHGPDAEPDYGFRAKLVCPYCGRIGAGTSIEPAAITPNELG